jgi:hypothetical protein
MRKLNEKDRIIKQIEFEYRTDRLLNNLETIRLTLELVVIVGLIISALILNLRLAIVVLLIFTSAISFIIWLERKRKKEIQDNYLL